MLAVGIAISQERIARNQEGIEQGASIRIKQGTLEGSWARGPDSLRRASANEGFAAGQSREADFFPLKC
jgi:hypothetical protein